MMDSIQALSLSLSPLSPPSLTIDLDNNHLNGHLRRLSASIRFASKSSTVQRYITKKQIVVKRKAYISIASVEMSNFQTIPLIQWRHRWRHLLLDFQQIYSSFSRLAFPNQNKSPKQITIGISRCIISLNQPNCSLSPSKRNNFV